MTKSVLLVCASNAALMFATWAVHQTLEVLAVDRASSWYLVPAVLFVGFLGTWLACVAGFLSSPGSFGRKARWLIASWLLLSGTYVCYFALAFFTIVFGTVLSGA